VAFALDLRGWFFPQPRKDYCMATLESHYGRFRIVVRFAGQKFCRSLQTENERSARSALARLEDNLARLKMGQLILPPGADLVTFLLSDGRLEQKPTYKADKFRTLGELLDEFLQRLTPGSLEPTPPTMLSLPKMTIRCTSVEMKVTSTRLFNTTRMSP
jgi:hypothetical protein